MSIQRKGKNRGGGRNGFAPGWGTERKGQVAVADKSVWGAVGWVGSYESTKKLWSGLCEKGWQREDEHLHSVHQGLLDLSVTNRSNSHTNLSLLGQSRGT